MCEREAFYKLLWEHVLVNNLHESDIKYQACTNLRESSEWEPITDVSPVSCIYTWHFIVLPLLQKHFSNKCTSFTTPGVSVASVCEELTQVLSEHQQELQL